MEIQNFVEKINKIKEKSKLDISLSEDLSIGLMNLISLEEHCFFSYVKTKDEKFLKTLEVIRELRKKLLALIVKKDDSERWCMSKHLLASSMRLYEVGTKLLHENKDKESKEMFRDASELYGLFWIINANTKNKIEIPQDTKEKKSIFSSIKKFLECCLE